MRPANELPAVLIYTEISPNTVGYLHSALTHLR
jgi:hypothetical protein